VRPAIPLGQQIIVLCAGNSGISPFCLLALRPWSGGILFAIATLGWWVLHLAWASEAHCLPKRAVEGAEPPPPMSQQQEEDRLLATMGSPLVLQCWHTPTPPPAQALSQLQPARGDPHSPPSSTILHTICAHGVPAHQNGEEYLDLLRQAASSSHLLVKMHDHREHLPLTERELMKSRIINLNQRISHFKV